MLHTTWALITITRLAALNGALRKCLPGAFRAWSASKPPGYPSQQKGPPNPVPQTQIWVPMWWNNSYWIAEEMCILSQHLTPCVHNTGDFIMSWLPITPWHREKGFLKLADPVRHLGRELTCSLLYFQFLKSSEVWGVYAEKNSTVSSKYRNIVTICQF